MSICRAVRLANPKSITISDDTYVGGGGIDPESIGYTFAAPITVVRVEYVEGKHFWDGGYWTSGPNLEAQVGGQWQPVANQEVVPGLPSAGDHSEKS